MNYETYQAVLNCYNHPTNTVGKGWDQDETLADTAFQFQIYDDFYYSLFHRYTEEANK